MLRFQAQVLHQQTSASAHCEKRLAEGSKSCRLGSRSCFPPPHLPPPGYLQTDLMLSLAEGAGLHPSVARSPALWDGANACPEPAVGLGSAVSSAPPPVAEAWPCFPGWDSFCFSQQGMGWRCRQLFPFLFRPCKGALLFLYVSAASFSQLSSCTGSPALAAHACTCLGSGGACAAFCRGDRMLLAHPLWGARFRPPSRNFYFHCLSTKHLRPVPTLNHAGEPCWFFQRSHSVLGCCSIVPTPLHPEPFGVAPSCRHQG